MNAALLTRSSHRKPNRPDLPFLGDLTLALGRVHEIAGPARRSLAAIIAAQMQGPIYWITPSWQPEQINPEGLCHLFEPGRLICIAPQRAEDLLWSMEEVLRSGAIPLVVADLPTPPALTPVRRLHLAAQTGFEVHNTWPLGLILSPDQGGAPGVETRWHMAGAHMPKSNGWRLKRLRARMAPPQDWHVVRKDGRFRIGAQNGAPETDGETLPASPIGTTDDSPHPRPDAKIA